jgi:hypothetical protein
MVSGAGAETELRINLLGGLFFAKWVEILKFYLVSLFG